MLACIHTLYVVRSSAVCAFHGSGVMCNLQGGCVMCAVSTFSILSYPCLYRGGSGEAAAKAVETIDIDGKAGRASWQDRAAALGFDDDLETGRCN